MVGERKCERSWGSGTLVSSSLLYVRIGRSRWGTPRNLMWLIRTLIFPIPI